MVVLSLIWTSSIIPQTTLRSREKAIVITITPKENSVVLVDGIEEGEGDLILKDIALGMRRIEVENPQYDFILTRDVLIERGKITTMRIDFTKRRITVKTDLLSSQVEVSQPMEDSADLVDRKLKYEDTKITGNRFFSYSQKEEEFGRFELGDRIKEVPSATKEYDKHTQSILLSYLGGIGTVIGLVLFSEGAFEYARNYYPSSDVAQFSSQPGIKALEIIGGLGIISLNVWFIVQQGIEADKELDLAVEKYNRSQRRELDLTLSEVAY